MKQIIKDKQRVADHGEVFTSQREVNAMLDLVKQETQRIDSKFLEPACGNGNFLVEILNRKLEIIIGTYKASQMEFERYSIIAMGSMYGVDILQDNVEECRARLLDIFKKQYIAIYKDKHKQQCIDTVAYILSKNILWGDALSLKTVYGNKDPIRFSEWTAINATMIKRRDYSLANLLDYQPMTEQNSHMTLFGDTGEQALIPPVLQEYPATHFLELSTHG